MRLFIYFLGTILLLGAFSCKNKKTSTSDDTPMALENTNGDLTDDSLLIGYETTPCFGQCPVYKLHIYKSGMATYEGIRFTDFEGKYVARLEKGVFEGLQQQLSQLDIPALNSTYDREGLMDVPSKKITFAVADSVKKVEARMDYPLTIQELIKRLEGIADSTRWKPQ